MDGSQALTLTRGEGGGAHVYFLSGTFLYRVNGLHVDCATSDIYVKTIKMIFKSLGKEKYKHIFRLILFLIKLLITKFFKPYPKLRILPLNYLILIFLMENS